MLKSATTHHLIKKPFYKSVLSIQESVIFGSTDLDLDILVSGHFIECRFQLNTDAFVLFHPLHQFGFKGLGEKKDLDINPGAYLA